MLTTTDTIDPISRQLVGNALAAIADEMAVTIFRTAHSTIVRDSMDFSTSLCDSHGQQVAQAVTVPFHLGAVPTAMQSLLSVYGDSLRENDIYIMNDPFDGGMHIPDVFVFMPVFVDANLVGFACTTAHHADLGGRVPGSAATDNTEIFQEGLRIPWLRLYSEGKPVDEVFKIIRANVRIPLMTLGDIAAQVAACRTGASGFRQLVEQHGAEELRTLMGDLIDYTERLVRGAIAAWPNGTAEFTDYLDSDGIDITEVPITVRVTIDGDEVTADFSDSAPMVRGALNCTESVTAAAVYLAVRSAVDIDVPGTAGAFRPVKIITRPATLTNVAMPGASSMRGVTGFRIVDAVSGALAQLLPTQIPAAGEGGNTLAIFGGSDTSGEPFVFYELICGTWGATSLGDGNDGLSNPASSAANIPIEVAESDFPIVIERYGLVADTGGAGKFRGGLGIERSWRLLVPEASLVVRSDRQIHRPYGLNGGMSGASSLNCIYRRGGKVETLGPMFTTRLFEGDVFYHRIAGGGGWGPPHERRREQIEQDRLEDKVTLAAVRRTYPTHREIGEIDELQTAVGGGDRSPRAIEGQVTDSGLKPS
jgi:N-methylhydantoinase B